jgi:hypothetical protein
VFLGCSEGIQLLVISVFFVFRIEIEIQSLATASSLWEVLYQTGEQTVQHAALSRWAERVQQHTSARGELRFGEYVEKSKNLKQCKRQNVAICH